METDILFSKGVILPHTKSHSFYFFPLKRRPRKPLVCGAAFPYCKEVYFFTRTPETTR